MDLFSDPSCTTYETGNGWGGGLNTLTWSNGSAAPATVYLACGIDNFNGNCTNYDLNLTSAPDPCFAPGLDDSFEDNDDCSTAAVMATGTHTGLFVAFGDEDYYAITVAAGDQLTVDQTYAGAVELYMDLYADPSCTTYLAGAGWGAGLNSLVWANSTGASATVYLACRIDDFTGNCTNYDLLVATAPDPCQNPAADDGFEDNDDCANATALADGTFPGLFVGKGDDDYYEVNVADGDTLFVDLTFTHAQADVDVYLYDDLVGCGDLNNYLVNGFSASDNENISWTNTSGALQTYYILVVVYANLAGRLQRLRHDDHRLRRLARDPVLLR